MLPFWEWSKKIRTDLGMSLDLLAEKTGYSKNYLSMIERNKPHHETGALPKPTIEYAKKVGEAYGPIYERQGVIIWLITYIFHDDPDAIALLSGNFQPGESTLYDPALDDSDPDMKRTRLNAEIKCSLDRLEYLFNYKIQLEGQNPGK